MLLGVTMFHFTEVNLHLIKNSRWSSIVELALFFCQNIVPYDWRNKYPKVELIARKKKAVHQHFPSPIQSWSSCRSLQYLSSRIELSFLAVSVPFFLCCCILVMPHFLYLILALIIFLQLGTHMSNRNYFFLNVKFVIVFWKKISCEGVVLYLKIYRKGFCPEWVSSYTRLISFQCGASCWIRLRLSVVLEHVIWVNLTAWHLHFCTRMLLKVE